MAARIDDPGQTDAPVDGPPLNKICDRRDWAHPAWQKALSDLGYSDDPARLHRKDWEFAQGVYGLRTLRCLSPDAAALGLGAGAEPIIYFLAGRLRRVVATDLYAGDFSGQEADPRILRDPEAFAPFSYHRDRLEVRRMDATTIDYGPESFDLVFSFSSFEHFGSRRAQRSRAGHGRTGPRRQYPQCRLRRPDIEAPLLEADRSRLSRRARSLEKLSHGSHGFKSRFYSCNPWLIIRPAN
jgi:hypothetical protein